MKSILFFDIDGTLLSEKTKIIPQSAIDAIKQAQNNGHLIFINTGRPLASIPKYIKDIHYDGIICGCGTYIEYQNKVLYHQSLDPQLISLILKHLKQDHMYALLEGKDALYYDQNNTYEHIDHIKTNYQKLGLDTSHTWDDASICFDKMTVWHDKQSDFDTFYKAMIPYFDYIKRSEKFGEWIPHHHSKATAMIFLSDYFHIDNENTYAFGDSTNDLPMLKQAKHAVAMKESNPEIFKYVEFITKDVDDDGIEYALKHYHLI